MNLFQTAQKMISDNENCEQNSYPDPLTGGAPWTIGWGSTGPDIGPGMTWTQGQCDARRDDYINQLIPALEKFVWFKPLDIPRQAAFVDMAYNMGLPSLKLFRMTIEATMAKDWVGVGARIIQSKYAAQVPRRAAKNIAQLITGVVI